MTRPDILRTALEQSARELNCRSEDFLKSDNVVTRLELGAGARRYYTEPISCNLVSYGSNVVASVKDGLRSVVGDYIGRYTFYECFETPAINALAEALAPMGLAVRHMAEYYLPDPDRMTVFGCGYELRLLEQRDFAPLYTPEWSNALCEKRRELDVLGVGAYDKGRLIALAGCSADCESMWQIGVDVLPEYRRRGVASAVTSTLAAEILRRGKVPFYSSAWSNLPSVRNAVKCGFLPAWVELTVKPREMQG